MAKGPRITDEVRRLIARIYLENPDWRAKEVRAEVSARLRKDNPSLPPDWPGLSTVQKELTGIRRRDEERPIEAKGLDKPWSIGTLVDYEIHPEAVPKVLEVKKSLEEIRHFLSIREARWVGRLCAITEDIKMLGVLAMIYAMDEHVSEIAETGHDTSAYDSVIRADPLLGQTLLIMDSNTPHRSQENREEYKRRIGQEEAERLESSLDLSLEREALPVNSLRLYLIFLRLIGWSKRWPSLSKEQQTEYVMGLRDWAKGQEETPSLFPSELLRKYDPDLAKSAEEVRDILLACYDKIDIH